MRVLELHTNAPAKQPFLLARTPAPAPVAMLASPFPASTSRLRLTFYCTLLCIDLLCIIVGFLAVGDLRLGSPVHEQALRTLAIVIPTFAAIALNSGAYSVTALRRPGFGARKTVEALLFASAVAVALLFYFKIGVQFSRLIFALGTALSLLLVLSARLLFGNYLGRKRRWLFMNELVIADDVPVGVSKGKTIAFAREMGIDPTTDDPLQLDRLSRLLDKCERVVVACPPERRESWTKALKGTNMTVEICAPELTSMGAISLGNFNGENTLVVSCGPLSTRDVVLKRALDLIVATFALVLLAPLMLLTAMAIKLESRGTILFRQKRLGENNRIFSLLKFRSMRIEHTDENGTRSVSTSDDRLTAVGKFIRSTSIDELPQLFNVLAGDMSIVGPRPHALGSTAGDMPFWKIASHYFDRHAIKPGITGLAQVRGFRGATNSPLDLTSRLQSDLEYVAGWTIWRDLKIICTTFRVLVHPNAY